jgi:hypothetical protein
MSPGSFNKPTPEEKAEWQAAYAEGFKAGKRQALRELKQCIKDIERLEPFSTFTSTTRL